MFQNQMLVCKISEKKQNFFRWCILGCWFCATGGVLSQLSYSHLSKLPVLNNIFPIPQQYCCPLGSGFVILQFFFSEDKGQIFCVYVYTLNMFQCAIHMVHKFYVGMQCRFMCHFLSLSNLTMHQTIKLGRAFLFVLTTLIDSTLKKIVLEVQIVKRMIKLLKIKMSVQHFLLLSKLLIVLFSSRRIVSQMNVIKRLRSILF